MCAFCLKSIVLSAHSCSQKALAYGWDQTSCPGKLIFTTYLVSQLRLRRDVNADGLEGTKPCARQTNAPNGSQFRKCVLSRVVRVTAASYTEKLRIEVGDNQRLSGCKHNSTAKRTPGSKRGMMLPMSECVGNARAPIIGALEAARAALSDGESRQRGKAVRVR
jgi:hypothetical protein